VKRKESPQVLGDLEVAVLEVIWSDGVATAKSAHGRLESERGISLNTVQSTLERLHRKGLLSREKRSHSYVYSATAPRHALVAQLMGQVADRLGTDAVTSFAAFVEEADELDEDALDALDAALRARRDRARREGQ
jgi:predicted transcriptional regulator